VDPVCNYSFGIDGLDSLFLGTPKQGNDIPNKSIILLRGLPGTGKTIMALNIFMKTNYVGKKPDFPKRIYLSCEETTESLKRYSDQFGWETKNMKENCLYFPYPPKEEYDTALERQNRILDFIQNYLAQKPEMLVIDGFSFLQKYVGMAEGIKDEEGLVRQFTRLLFKLLKQEEIKKCLFIITAECQPARTREAASCEEHLADIVIDLTLTESIPGMRQRRLEITKSRHVQQRLGDHSYWIVNNETPQLFDDDPQKGIVVYHSGPIPFENKNESEQSSNKPESINNSKKLLFGIEGLDSLLMPEKKTIRQNKNGLEIYSNTVIMGPTGTGKMFLGLSFVLEGAVSNKHTMVISFDQPESEIKRYYQDLVTRDPNKSTTLGAMVNSNKIRLFYQSPVNLDLARFLHQLEHFLSKEQISRVFIDSISEVERCLEHPERFIDFLIALFSVLRHHTTSVITYEVHKLSGQLKALDAAISFQADNIIETRHISVDDRLRNVIFLIKKRGGGFMKDIRELIIEIGATWRRVKVTRHLDYFTDLLTGTPRPIEVFIKLFAENKMETKYNQKLVKRLKDRYPYLKASSFTREEMEEILQPDQMFEAPLSNVRVVSLDEHWIQRLANLSDGYISLKVISADEFPPEELAQFYYPLTNIACCKDIDADSKENPERSLLAVPNYLDLGLFCYRKDILFKYNLNPPVFWDTGGKNELNDLVSICKEILEQEKDLTGFAFDMTTPQTLVATFIEFVWNFGADPGFFREYSTEEQEQKEKNMQCMMEALNFIHSLIYTHKILAFPCFGENSTKAIFSRQWYSTLQNDNVDKDNKVDEDDKAGKTDKKLEIACAPLPISRKSKEIIIDFYNKSFKKYAAIIDSESGKEIPENRKRFLEAKKAFLTRFVQSTESENSIPGVSCSGTWYLGILESGKTHQLAANIIREMTSLERSSLRLTEGAGLPVRDFIYDIYGNQTIPGLSADWTLKRMRCELLENMRSRTAILGNRKTIKYDEVVKIMYQRIMNALNHPDCDSQKIVQEIFDKITSNPAHLN
jgi:KaiC/GvpD/RAD55 family RecA-like ATPase/ABC-type glycerol-3-phosphate transport system substrate-binding protein